MPPPITFTSTDRAAVPAVLTAIALTTWTNGAATFSVTLNTPGAQTVTAYFPLDTYGSPLITGTSTNIAVAAVPPASSFTVQPSSQTISSGSTVVFNANARETPAPSYQWFFNGSALANGSGVSGVTGPTLVINGATSANAGSYYRVAANTLGFAPEQDGGALGDDDDEHRAADQHFVPGAGGDGDQHPHSGLCGWRSGDLGHGVAVAPRLWSGAHPLRG